MFSVTVRWFHRVKARKTATNDDVEGGGGGRNFKLADRFFRGGGSMGEKLLTRMPPSVRA